MSMKNVSLTFLNLFLPHINKIKSSKNINTILKKIYTNIKLSKEYHAVMFKNVEMKKIEIDDGNKEEILNSLSLIGSDSFVPENINDKDINDEDINDEDISDEDISDEDVINYERR